MHNQQQQGSSSNIYQSNNSEPLDEPEAPWTNIDENETKMDWAVDDLEEIPSCPDGSAAPNSNSDAIILKILEHQRFLAREQTESQWKSLFPTYFAAYVWLKQATHNWRNTTPIESHVDKFCRCESQNKKGRYVDLIDLNSEYYF
jgi:hypothetical protein